MPLVTVILSTFNWSAVLPFSIESVLGQTFSDYELLVVGDGCTDNSAEIVARYADPRIHFINLPLNTGSQHGPNNEGLRQAKGRLVAYLGHDDQWSRDHLANMVAFCKDRDEVCAVAGIVMFDEAANVLGVSLVDAIPSGVMHTHSLAAKIGYWKDYKLIRDHTTDTDFFLRMKSVMPWERTMKISVAKVPAAIRKDIYRRRDVTPQRKIAEKLKANPNFLEAAAFDYLLQKVVTAHFQAQQAVIKRSLLMRTRKLLGDLGLRDLRHWLERLVGRDRISAKNYTVKLRKFKGLE